MLTVMYIIGLLFYKYGFIGGGALIGCFCRNDRCDRHNLRIHLVTREKTDAPKINKKTAETVSYSAIFFDWNTMIEPINKRRLAAIVIIELIINSVLTSFVSNISPICWDN